MADTTQSPYFLGILPSRWGSTRFPGKPLHLIAGKPLIQHVWERCLQCEKLDEVLVATDDERIQAAVEGFGGKVVMTSADHPTGTDRLAEAVQAIPEHDLVVFAMTLAGSGPGDDRLAWMVVGL